MVYGEHVEFSGPHYRTMSQEGSTLNLYFDNADGGLVMKGEALVGFEIAGPDGRFRSCCVYNSRNDRSPFQSRCPKTTQARYGWLDDPVCNLFNKAGLPCIAIPH